MYIERIKKLRKSKRITQIEMSIKLGLSESAYGLYETRQRQMDIDTLVKICRILNTTPNELLGYKGE